MNQKPHSQGSIVNTGRLGESNVQRDPVCGMMVDEKRAKLKSECDGRTYYFCSAWCKSNFDKDPNKYGYA
jgi:Cu+-exporting ATPase